MSVSECDFRAAIEVFERVDSIGLFCHVNPDGDALGSMLALGLALETKFPSKAIAILSHDGVPDIYAFLPCSDQIKPISPLSKFDLVVALDSGDIKRTGERFESVINESSVRMDIDHHVGEGAFGDVRLLDSKAAATAEIVYDLLRYMDAPITQDIATCLLTGVITDTGSFRFLNVTPRTLRTAASLIEYGATPSLIAEQVFDNRTFPGTKLLGLCLSTLQITADGLVTYASVAHEYFAETGAHDPDTEGFINFIRSIRGSEVALLFREYEVGTVRVSLRSSDKVDVAKIANKFGGGGHKMAAGCTIHGSLDEAQHSLMAAVTDSLNQSAV